MKKGNLFLFCALLVLLIAVQQLCYTTLQTEKLKTESLQVCTVEVLYEAGQQVFDLERVVNVLPTTSGSSAAHKDVKTKAIVTEELQIYFSVISTTSIHKFYVNSYLIFNYPYHSFW